MVALAEPDATLTPDDLSRRILQRRKPSTFAPRRWPRARMPLDRQARRRRRTNRAGDDQSRAPRRTTAGRGRRQGARHLTEGSVSQTTAPGPLTRRCLGRSRRRRAPLAAALDRRRADTRCDPPRVRIVRKPPSPNAVVDRPPRHAEKLRRIVHEQLDGKAAGRDPSDTCTRLRSSDASTTLPINGPNLEKSHRQNGGTYGNGLSVGSAYPRGKGFPQAPVARHSHRPRLEIPAVGPVPFYILINQTFVRSDD